MRARDIRKFDMLRRVQGFLDDYAASLGVVNATGARKEFDQLVREMGINETAQAISTLDARGQTALQASLRRELVVRHMRPVARIAAVHLRDVPEFEALRPPQKDIKVAVLIQEAIAMAEAARLHEQVFVEYGCPADFVDALLAAAEAVRASIDARAESIMTRAGAREGISATASRAHLVLRVLDALVQIALAHDPKALAAWSSVKRIGKGKVVSIEAMTPTATTQEVKPAA